MTAFGYARASKGPGDGQIQMLLNAGIEPGALYVDDSVSGVSLPATRPAYSALRQQLQPGDTVTVKDLRRVSRRKTHQVAALQDLVAHEIRLDSLSPPEREMLAMLYRNASPVESAIAEAILLILAALAEQDWIHTREAIVAGQQKARQSGKRIGRPPVSEHDREVLQMLAGQGLSHSAIAARTGLSRATVGRYCPKTWTRARPIDATP